MFLFRGCAQCKCQLLAGVLLNNGFVECLLRIAQGVNACVNNLRVFVEASPVFRGSKLWHSRNWHFVDPLTKDNLENYCTVADVRF